MNKKRLVILVSADEVGSKMAGPGIRYFEFAKVLANSFQVNLFTPNQSDIKNPDFEIISFNNSQLSKKIVPLLGQSPIIISQNLGSKLLAKIRKSSAKFIYDLYDPNIVEILEYAKDESVKRQRQLFNFNWATFLMHLSAADHLLCASDRQKDFYFGILSKLKIINPAVYDKSPDLKKLVSIIPFGMPNEAPTMINNKAVEKKYPAIKSTDKIIYWGGGVWNWFDAISVVKAINQISKKRSDIKLIFAGFKHPNSKIKTMAMQQKVVDYCQKNQLENKFVFYNFDWTPYSERVNYLLRSSVGISTHFDNLETRLSFRTRILDYLWAELPIVATKGDIFAELIEQYNIGKVVDFEDVKGITIAIEKLVDENELVSGIKKNIAMFKPRFYWENCLKPLAEIIKNDHWLNLRQSGFKFYLLVFKYLWAGFKKKYLN